MGNGASAPTPVPAGQTANVQAGYNQLSGIESQLGSMIGQNNQYGNTSYNQTGSYTDPNTGQVIPLYGENTNLNPQQQGLLNTQVSGQQAAGAGGASLISGANYGSVSPTQAIGNETSGLAGQMMSGYMQQMQPFFTQQTQQLDTQLKNQGLMPSPTANPSDPSTWGPYERAMYQNQTTQANQVAGEAAQFQPQAFSEASSLYTMPAQLGTQLGQYGAPTSPTSQLIQTPGLSIAAPSYEGDVAQQEAMQESNYQAQIAQQNAMMSGLFGLGGNVLGGLARGIGGNTSIFSSDRRIKKHIRKVGYLLAKIGDLAALSFQ
jgi:hypothetical protein